MEQKGWYQSLLYKFWYYSVYAYYFMIYWAHYSNICLLYLYLTIISISAYYISIYWAKHSVIWFSNHSVLLSYFSVLPFLFNRSSGFGQMSAEVYTHDLLALSICIFVYQNKQMKLFHTKRLYYKV